MRVSIVSSGLRGAHVRVLQVHSNADAYDQKELTEVFEKYQITSDGGNALSPPFPFNLMFQTSIGPSGQLVGWAPTSSRLCDVLLCSPHDGARVCCV